MRHTVIAFIVSCCVWAAGANAAVPDHPQGVAPYVELQRELFLAGLYVPGGADSAQAAFAAGGSRAMELRFMAEQLMVSKLSRLFIQSVAINTNPQAQRRSGDSLARFFNALKGRLHRGDVLRIVERADASGARVVLNDVQLVAIDDPDFFNLLLATWVGAVPPSRAFKLALLGDSDPALLARYRDIQPPEERRRAVALWVRPIEPAPAGEPEPADPKVVEASEPAPAPEPSGEELVAQQAASSSSASAPARVSAPVMADSGKPAPAEPDGPVVADAGETAVADAAPAGKTPPEPAPQEEAAPAFSGEILQAIQRYTAELVNLTHEHVRYPRRAMKLRQTGSVRMAVVIDASGEVVKMQPLLESGHSQLDDAVERAIRNTEPYPEIPGRIAAEQFEFVFPITFMLES